MAKLDIKTLLATAASVPAALPATAGAPVRNVQRSPEVEKQKERGVRTLSLSLFPPQSAKLDVLATYLLDHDLGFNDSLAFRAALSLVDKNQAFGEAARRVASGTGWKKRNVMAYAEDDDVVKELARFLRRFQLRPVAAIVHRAVIEVTEPGPAFLAAAKDLKERRDRRGKAT